MPSSFDTAWRTGPMGPFPLLVLSQGDLVSERNYIIGRIGGLGGSGVFQIAGAVVQYNTKSTTTATVFRRTLNRRVGARSIL